MSLFVYLGYVESMKNLLFSLSISTLKEVAERNNKYKCENGYIGVFEQKGF